MKLGGLNILPGTRVELKLPVPPLYTNAAMDMPVTVIRGKKDGPRLFVSAAIHGDEINGVEIVRRLLASSFVKRITGTLILVPVVNVYGYVSKSRYLPDRRDLNRAFPGSAKGSMTARLAHSFMTEIVANASHGIDLHTGAKHRTNLPQIRTSLNDHQALAMAKAFRVPVILNAELRDGSLRATAAESGCPVLLYEAGEALRFDEFAIRAGLRGIVNVMRHLGMLPEKKVQGRSIAPQIAQESRWVRANGSGILLSTKNIGDAVQKNEVMAHITDPLGSRPLVIRSPVDGIVIGQATLPLVHEGEALFNVAHTEKADQVEASLPHFYDNLERLDESDFAPL
ncbi:succinylglutamate desuccinylase/aspartoacylase family protein [Gallaecimonas kandeliae]|uniref:succinylglutamate desuccinylase/aspartoacylase family protein n=1 Tax=Gallaecimonas kandeliae TaxID=3029055 RepID=UPI00264895B3|nr:succinylglutamate desuccinylase/aspartoacylase family protein [Gallaecimonas kandeliae]WKE64382.1 succinylglutamate desuccinylase/aspartoacylase family protein [Gallaecimonas kandeliae]